MPGSERLGEPSRRAFGVLLGGAAVVAMSFAVQRLGVAASTVRALDNVHWTVAHVTAAIVAWMGVCTAPAEDTRTIRWFARGLTFYAVGGVIYALQIAIGWNPFPGPADAFTLCAGPCCWAGMRAAVHAGLAPAERSRVRLDAAALNVALVTLTLALYLPHRGTLSALELATLIAYPVGLLIAGTMGAMLIPSLRLQGNRGVLIMVGSLFLMGLLWMRWNLLAFGGKLADGTWFNLVFSLGALGLGLGALTWRSRPSRSAAWNRAFEVALRMLPLIVVIFAAAAVIVVSVTGAVSVLVERLVIVGALITTLLAMARQHLMLSESTRLFEAETRLLDAERKFRTLFESATYALLVLGPTHFMVGNPSALKLFQLEDDSLRAFTPTQLSAQHQPDGSDSATQIAGRIQAALRGEFQFFEWRFRRSDGTDFDAEVSLNLLESDRQQLLQWSIHDITVRRRAEATQRRLEADLERALRLEALGRLAGGVAHDFNNMLTVILGVTEIMLGNNDKDSREDLLEIRDAGRRAAELTKQLLAFGRKQIIDPVPQNLNALVGAAVKMLERLIGDQVTFQYHPAASLGTVRVDRTQVEQILVNLSVNARDAMPGGGVLTIETSNVHLDANQVSVEPGLAPGAFVCLRVSDTGGGMSAETKARLFEPFFTTKELGKGTGLGLATIHGIVRQGGGLVEVESTSAGTTFRVYFPRTDELPIAAAEESLPGAPGPVGTILLVEDDDLVRRVVCRLLESAGYHVLARAGLSEAVEDAKDQAVAFDLLVTDVILKGSNGHQVREVIHRLRPGLPVLFVSGHTADIIAPHQVLEPGTHFLQKPFTADRLTEAIREAIENP